MSKQRPMSWLSTGADKPPRERLSVPTIVEAAYAVLDRDGFDKLSMRAVAAELGVAVSSLYAHVANKDALMHQMWVRSFLDSYIPEPTEDREEWTERLRLWARSTRAGLRSHRDLARVSMGQTPFSDESLPLLERTMAFFRSGGLPEELVMGAGDFMSTFIEGFVYEEQVWEERMNSVSPSERQAMVDEVREYFERLDPELYPNMSRLGPVVMRNMLNDDRFDRAIEIFIQGLLAQANRG
ncbi:transcriptional regulator [Actinorhabdospora filicis]|uniref:Transcriptional regulator n=1 Tax=Actinorhabdospora filicis TaxID=1785913 RepID=A0A9W6SH10_9ACTN|nr:TetR/AcrR family transcriptional regulator [Actinorhabdospora filicis]GLZ75822.1 transcriptional regulator [Actinorhabdospora filicis]